MSDANWFVTQSLAQEHTDQLERRTLRATRELPTRRFRRPWRRH